GHGAFMALGGYAAGMVTYYGSMLIWSSASKHGGFLGAGEWLFFVACVFGGCLATIAGYVVGLPSLRLKGDYLAIVTLGFGEILRVMLQRTNEVLGSAEEVHKASLPTLATSLGGSLGFSGIPYYTDLFWVYSFVTVMLVVALRLKFSSYGRAFLSVRENEIAAEA